MNITDKLRQLRDGDQFLSTGGDGCEFAHALLFMVLLGETMVKEMPKDNQDEANLKILEGLGHSLTTIKRVMALPSQYDALDKIIDLVEACDAERDNLIKSAEGEETGEQELIDIEEWKKDGSLPYSYPLHGGKDNV